MQQLNKQKGFTLIELIIVIIILGILAVTAAPKFLDIQDDARESVLRGVEGSVRAAVQIVHSASLVNPNDTTVSLEGQVIDIEFEYPGAHEICNAIGLIESVIADNADSTTDSIDAQLECDYTDTAAAGADVMIIRPNVTTPLCSVTYTEAIDGGVPSIAIDNDCAA